jgi:Ca2+-binding RTX toxin-like protein
MAAPTRMQPLEARRLLAATLDANGTLFVSGTWKDDVISVATGYDQTGLPASIVVVVDGRLQTFPQADVHALRVHGRRGNDRVGVIVRQPLDSLRISGEGGNDVIEPGQRGGRVYGDSGDDTLIGSEGDDTIFGGAGDDLIGGGRGRDKLYGDEGDDTIVGGAKADLLEGGAGDDSLFGNDGNDLLRDTSGSNSLFGGSGDDRLYNGPAALGLVNGGPGRDRFRDPIAGDGFDPLEDDADPLPDPFA